MTLLGTEIGELPTSAPRGKVAERILAGELLDELRSMHASLTSFMERYNGRLLNHVLALETAKFDTSGYITRNFSAAAGCIEIETSTNPVIVSAAGPGGSAPDIGVGVYKVPANSHRVVTLGSTIFTLYGTAGDTVSFQVFTLGASPVVA